MNILQVRDLKWSKKKNHGGKTEKTSPQPHIVVSTRKAAQASCADQTIQHTLTLTLRHHTSWTHAHLSQLSAVRSPSKKMSQRVAGITLPINSDRLHIIQSHTLLNPIVPYVQKIQLHHFSVAQCSQRCCPITSASQRCGRYITAISVSNSETLTGPLYIESSVRLLHCLMPRVTASCTKGATCQADLALAVTQTSTCIRDDPTTAGWLSWTPLRFSATDGHAIDLGSLWAQTDKSGRSNGINLCRSARPLISPLRQKAEKADGSRGPRSSEFMCRIAAEVASRMLFARHMKAAVVMSEVAVKRQVAVFNKRRRAVRQAFVSVERTSLLQPLQ